MARPRWQGNGLAPRIWLATCGPSVPAGLRWSLLPAERAESRNEWSWEKGSLLLAFVHTVLVINRGLLPSLLKECQLFGVNHGNRNHPIPSCSLPWLGNEIFPACLSGSWRNFGSMSNTRPLRLTLDRSGEGPPEGKTSWISWVPFGRPPRRPQCLTGMSGQCAERCPPVPVLMHCGGWKQIFLSDAPTFPIWGGGGAEMSAHFCYWQCSIW